MTERHLVKTLCVVSANLEKVDRIVCNKHWWNFGRRHELASFLVQLIPGHADLRFRLLSGRKLVNDEGDRVEVDWGATGLRTSVRSMNELDQMFV